MSPSDGMKNTDKKREAHETPVDKMSLAFEKLRNEFQGKLSPVERTRLNETSLHMKSLAEIVAKTEKLRAKSQDEMPPDDRTPLNKFTKMICGSQDKLIAQIQDDMLAEEMLAEKMPANKMTTNKMSVDKTSVAKSSFGEMSFSFDNMSLALEEVSPALDTKAVDKMAVEDMVVGKMSSLVLDKAPVDKVSTGAKRRNIEPATEKSKPKTGFRFMDLPYNIRSQIRHEALLMDDDRGKPFLTSGLASVSKEWRDDIDGVLFNDITINPLDHQEVSAFKEMFSTDRRRQLLTRLNIAIDDSETGPWHRQGGLVEIERIVPSIVKFLGYISGWDFRKNGGGWRPLQIAFATSQFPNARFDWSHGQRLLPNTTTLWKANWKLDLKYPAWNLAQVPPPKLPYSLDMVTHLSIPPDCLDYDLMVEFMKSMPNLETLVIDPRFDVEDDEPWDFFEGYIDAIHSSAPSLQNLTLRNTAYIFQIDPNRETFPAEFKANFSAALRDNSQQLRSLRANPFEVDEEFVRPFSPRKVHVYRNTWRWPRLQHVDLQFYVWRYDGPDSVRPDREDKFWDKYEAKLKQLGQDTGDEKPLYNHNASDYRHETSSLLQFQELNPAEPILEPAEILIAAGRATMAMPVLESAHISVWPQPQGSPSIFAKRKLCPKSGSTSSSRMWLSGDFHPRARSHIMDAWAHFLGTDPQVDEGLRSEFPDEQRSPYPTHVPAHH